MKKFLMALMMVFSAVSMVVPEAEAKRLGGGGSFGKQSQNANRAAPAQSQQATAARPAPTAGAAPKAPSPWRGILGGALLGLGLGALLSHLGIGAGLASMISTILMVGLLAMAAMFIYRMFKAKTNGGNNRQPAFNNGFSEKSRTPEIGSGMNQPYGQPAALQSVPMGSGAVADAGDVPADFDIPGFVRNAKTYFIRLQAAWDRADINDIREFTTPEMFAELKLQLQERGASENQTDVVTLDGDLMGVETVGDEYLATVKFTGMIKESADAPAMPFSEAWNLSKPVNGNGGWTLAGIQQLS